MCMASSFRSRASSMRGGEADSLGKDGDSGTRTEAAAGTLQTAQLHGLGQLRCGIVRTL